MLYFAPTKQRKLNKKTQNIKYHGLTKFSKNIC